MKYRISKLEAMEASGERPAGYVEAYRRAAHKADDAWLWVDDEQQDKLIRKYRKPRGLGDVVERAIDKVTLGTGKRVATAAARLVGKKKCRCDERRDKLNQMVPFNRNQPRGTIDPH